MQEGYAYINGFIALDGWMKFSGVEPAKGESYLEQETAKLLKIAKEAWELK